ncbi:PREDICTED: uncharacterized protein LOC105143993 [Acromyrmex echinatior]|uniref:uncharacterized protein LOC105143993 n=1 Tax=Acromyrmex echinatior TaxID=103372 RepID=UPI00058109FB|nr:PREDICTED: uncharacterized protein LOC105143993 [Acromyrmex echinatior]
MDHTLPVKANSGATESSVEALATMSTSLRSRHSRSSFFLCGNGDGDAATGSTCSVDAEGTTSFAPKTPSEPSIQQIQLQGPSATLQSAHRLMTTYRGQGQQIPSQPVLSSESQAIFFIFRVYSMMLDCR